MSKGGKKLVLEVDKESKFPWLKVGVILGVLLTFSILIFNYFLPLKKAGDNFKQGILYSLKDDEKTTKIKEKEVLSGGEKNIALKEIFDGEIKSKEVLKGTRFGELNLENENIIYVPFNGFLGQDSTLLKINEDQILLKFNVVNCNEVPDDGTPDCSVVCDYDTQNKIQDCNPNVCEVIEILDNGIPTCPVTNEPPESKDLTILIEPKVGQEKVDLTKFINENLKDVDNSLPLKFSEIKGVDKILETQDRLVLNVGEKNIASINKNENALTVNLGGDRGRGFFYFQAKDNFGEKNLIKKISINIDCSPDQVWNDEDKICEVKVGPKNITNFCLENDEVALKPGICKLKLKLSDKNYIAENVRIEKNGLYSEDCFVDNEPFRPPLLKASYLVCKKVPAMLKSNGLSSERFELFFAKDAVKTEIFKLSFVTDCAGIGAVEKDGLWKCDCEVGSRYDITTRKCEKSNFIEELKYFRLTPNSTINLHDKVKGISSVDQSYENIRAPDNNLIKKIELKVLRDGVEFKQAVYLAGGCSDGEDWDGEKCIKNIFNGGGIECKNGLQNAVMGGKLKCNLEKVVNRQLVINDTIPKNLDNICKLENDSTVCQFDFTKEDQYLWEKSGDSWKNIGKILFKANEIYCRSGEYADKNDNICKTCAFGQVPNLQGDGCQACGQNTILKDGKCEVCADGEYPNFGRNSCVLCNSNTGDNIPDCQADCDVDNCKVCDGDCDNLNGKNISDSKVYTYCQLENDKNKDDGILQCPKMKECDLIATNGIKDCEENLKIIEKCDTEKDNGVPDCKKVNEAILPTLHAKPAILDEEKLEFDFDHIGSLKLVIQKNGQDIEFIQNGNKILIDKRFLGFGKNELIYFLKDVYGNESQKQVLELKLSCSNGLIYDESNKKCGKIVNIQDLENCLLYPRNVKDGEYFNCIFTLKTTDTLNYILPKGGINFVQNFSSFEDGFKNKKSYPCMLENNGTIGVRLNCMQQVNGGNFNLEGLDNKPVFIKTSNELGFAEWTCDNIPNNGNPDCFVSSSREVCDLDIDNGVPNCDKNEDICEAYDKIAINYLKNKGGIVAENVDVSNFVSGDCFKKSFRFIYDNNEVNFILNQKDDINAEGDELKLTDKAVILTNLDLIFTGSNFEVEKEVVDGLNYYTLRTETPNIISIQYNFAVKKNYITIFIALLFLFVILNFKYILKCIKK